MAIRLLIKRPGPANAEEFDRLWSVGEPFAGSDRNGAEILPSGSNERRPYYLPNVVCAPIDGPKHRFRSALAHAAWIGARGAVTIVAVNDNE